VTLCDDRYNKVRPVVKGILTLGITAVRPTEDRETCSASLMEEKLAQNELQNLVVTVNVFFFFSANLAHLFNC